jgi:hypothetical protein
MAAPDFTVSRLGQINETGDVRALFLKVFANEVLNSFNRNLIFGNLHRVKEIDNGKSYQFPAIGQTTSGYHTPGTMIVGDPIAHAERIINVDEVLFSSVSIAEIDELINHYDVRSEYAKQLGQAVAQRWDKNVAQLLALAARDSATITGGNGGTVLNAGATVETDGTVLAAAIFDAVQAMEEKDVPPGDIYCAVRPAQYYNLVQATDNINKDWGGMGSYAEGKVLKIGGVPIVKSNAVPSTTVSAVTGENNTYDGNFSATMALVFHRAAVGTVRLRGLKTEMTGEEYRVTHGSTLMKTSLVCGSGILRPECAVEITNAV